MMFRLRGFYGFAGRTSWDGPPSGKWRTPTCEGSSGNCKNQFKKYCRGTMMTVFIIYCMLFTFWVEHALGFKLTDTAGLSLSNLCIYALIIAWFISLIRRAELYKKTNINMPII